MRRWLIALGIVVLLGAGALGIAVANLDSYLNENRDLVGEKASEALGRRVAFGDVGLSLAGGLGVRVGDLRVGDDPGFSEADFLTAEAVDVRVKLLPALFGNIEVARVVLRSPSITLIQTADGLSIDSLGGAAGGDEPSEGGSSPALLVSVVDVKDGTLRFRDETASPPLEVAVDRLDFEASDVSLDEPVRFDLSAAILGASDRNLRASGTVGPVDADVPRLDVDFELDPTPLDDALRLGPVASALPAELALSGPIGVALEATGTLTDLAFDARLDATAADVRYGESFSSAAGQPLRLSLRGERRGDELSVDAADLVIDDTELHATAKAKNLDAPEIAFTLASEALRLAALGMAEGDASPPEVLRDLDLRGTLVLAGAGPALDATVRSPAGTVSGADYRNLEAKLGFRNERLDLSALSLEAFGGGVNASGSYDQSAARPRFDVKAQLTDVQVAELVASRTATAARFLSGSFSGNVDLKGSGSTWDEMKPVLTGLGDLAIKDGVIRDFNPAGGTLRALVALPLLSGSGLKRFLDDHPQLVGVGDTEFEAFDGKLEIRDGWVHLRDLELAARDYSVRGQGRYSLENQLDLTTVLTLSAKLSEELLASEKKLAYLRGADGRVEIPVAVKGSAPKLAVVPDVSGVARTASREALTGLVDRALGGGKEPAGAEEAGEEAAPAAPEPADLGRDLLKRGIGGLLGGGSDADAPPAEPSTE